MQTMSERKAALAHEKAVIARLTQAQNKPASVVVPQKKKVGTLVSDIAIEEMDFVWKNFLACGVVSMVVGKGGTGKTTLMCDIIAHVTTGSPFHDGSETEKGGVVIAFMEDKTSISAKKKLLDARADVTQVLDISRVEVEQTTLVSSVKYDDFRLPDHLDILELAIVQVNARFVVLDNLSAIVPLSENKMIARKIMARLSAMAIEHNCSIMIVNHPKKGKFNPENWTTAIGGSQAWYDACRFVWAIVPDDNDSKIRNITAIKNNLGLSAPMLQYVGIKDNERFYIQFLEAMGTSMIPELDSTSENVNAILYYMLQKSIPISATMVLNELTINGVAMARGTVSSILTRLKEEGIVTQPIYAYYELKEEYVIKLEALNAPPLKQIA